MIIVDKKTDLTYNTRRKRRAAIKTILASLSAIRDAELKYLENVPENLQSSESYEAGELAADTLDEVIDSLNEVY